MPSGRQPTTAPVARSTDTLRAGDLLALQRQAGNRAVAEMVQRQGGGGAGAAGSGGGGGAASCSTPGCPPSFCANIGQSAAEASRFALTPAILAGIAAKVDSRVVPLWVQYIAGGTGPQNLTSTFGADFTRSLTTRRVTANLRRSLRAALLANPPTFPPGRTRVTLDLNALIPTELAGVNVPGHANEMDFNVIGEVPGNIAGGIGTNQTSCAVGARPSPFNDSREAFGTVDVDKQPDGSLRVTPNLGFRVRDTIDLCPGNCGAAIEMVATIPLSQWEASGISGDVPFTVTFPGNMAPFTIPSGMLPAPPPAPPSGPVTGTVRASPHLRIRSGPGTQHALIGNYPNGTAITIECGVHGEAVQGNDRWDRTDRGFVADRYVVRSATPTGC